MCGLAGVLAGPRAQAPDADELRRMIAMLGHRGPDGYGLLRDGPLGLAHSRLSIVGLEGGFQPLANEDGTIWVSFNGEIFNHIELRRELVGRGHRFATATDTEVIVHAFEEWGPAAWTRFNGQFAFALWDGPARRLWLVRDRLGILPLHYALAGGSLVFASEVKALLAGGRLATRFDAGALARVFAHWTVAPYGSVFAGVQAVPPGTALAIDTDLKIEETRYWRPDFTVDPVLARLSLDEAAERLAERLETAVRLRLRADVPVGVYISGGLDSSVIAALARRCNPGNIHSFGIRFADPAFDETGPQRLVAAHLGTRHHEIVCGPQDIQAALPDVVWHCETPLLRTAPAPLFLLSRLVHDSGIRVVLSGEGADEWLAGYDIFKEDRIRRFWARQPDSAARPQLLERIHAHAALAGAKDNRLWQQFFRRGLADTGDDFHSHRIRWDNTAWALRLLSPDVRAAADLPAAEAAIAAFLPSGWRQWDDLSRAQMLEIDTFMSPYLLSSQGDRVAMAHGVEVRYPFLDPEVDSLCAALPGRLRMLGLRDKLALRRLAAPLLPAEIGQRPKRPYRAPTTSALFGTGAPDYVRELMSPEALGRSGLIDASAATRLVARAHERQGQMGGEREEMALVGLLTLQILHHAFVDDFPARTRDRLAALAAAPCRVLQVGRDAAPAIDAKGDSRS
jgi:asparagine synthase (glutamine-hydrolysing)